MRTVDDITGVNCILFQRFDSEKAGDREVSKFLGKNGRLFKTALSLNIPLGNVFEIFIHHT